jgi:hypothetical protein
LVSGMGAPVYIGEQFNAVLRAVRVT